MIIISGDSDCLNEYKTAGNLKRKTDCIQGYDDERVIHDQKHFQGYNLMKCICPDSNTTYLT